METIERSRSSHQKIVEDLVADLKFPVEVLLDDREILPEKDNAFEYLFDRFKEKYSWELNRYREIEKSNYECDFKRMLIISDQQEGANKKVGKGKKFSKKNGAEYMEAVKFFAPETKIPNLEVNMVKVRDEDWSEELNKRYKKYCTRRNEERLQKSRNQKKGNQKGKKDTGRKVGTVTVAAVKEAVNGERKDPEDQLEKSIISAKLIEDSSIPAEEEISTDNQKKKLEVKALSRNATDEQKPKRARIFRSNHPCLC